MPTRNETKPTNEPSKEAMDAAEEIDSLYDQHPNCRISQTALIIHKHFQKEREEVREVLENVIGFLQATAYSSDYRCQQSILKLATQLEKMK